METSKSPQVLMEYLRGGNKMINEKKLIQFAYNWAVHIWYKLDLYVRENPDDSKESAKQAEKLLETIKEIEKIAQSKGYTL